MRRESFTLIELLVVVAILGILATIGVSNYRNATIKTRVAQVKMDLRTFGTALQMYRLDHNMYPRKNNDLLFFTQFLLPDLTTPIAYLNSGNVHDPFGPVSEYVEPVFSPAEDSLVRMDELSLTKNSYTYTPYINFAALHGLAPLRKEGFAVASVGPDRMDSFIVDIPFPLFYRYPGDSVRDSIYHPSNGLLSSGDIGYFGGDISIQGLMGG